MKKQNKILQEKNRKLKRQLKHKENQQKKMNGKNTGYDDTERALIETYKVRKNAILIQSLMLLSVRKSLARSRPAGNFTNQILRHSINCGLLIFICVLLATDCKNENF